MSRKNKLQIHLERLRQELAELQMHEQILVNGIRSVEKLLAEPRASSGRVNTLENQLDPGPTTAGA